MSPASPKVSVVLPTRNRAHLLPRALHSVLAQTYGDFELIVVNDASTDATEEVLASVRDPRLKVLRREKNSGAAAARNAGIRIAQGEFLAFQDDDDAWLVEKLDKQMQRLLAAPPAAGLCLAGYIRLHPGGASYIGGERFMRVFDYKGGNYFNGGPDYSLIATPGWLVRRAALEQAGLLFDERFRSFDDWELGLRLADVCSFVHVDEPLFVQDQVRGSGMMYDEHKHAHDTRLFMEKHGARWRGQPKVLSRHYYVIGRSHAGFTAAQRRRWLWRALRERPLFVKAWLAWSLTLLGDAALQGATRLVRGLRRYLKGPAAIP